MSIQWMLLAGFLYTEIAAAALLILPIAGPRRWARLFNSSLSRYFSQHVALYFYVLLGVLMLFAFDAIREMRKYSGIDTHGSAAAELKNSVKLFRAQRNFYITSFSIFLVFVIRRLVTMIIDQADLLDCSEQIVKRTDRKLKEAKDIVVKKELELANEMLENDKALEILKSELKIAEQSSLAQAQMIKEMSKEIELWQIKCEKLENRLKDFKDKE